MSLVPANPIMIPTNGGPKPPPTNSNNRDNNTRIRPEWFLAKKNKTHMIIKVAIKMDKTPETKKLGTIVIAGSPDSILNNSESPQDLIKMLFGFVFPCKISPMPCSIPARAKMTPYAVTMIFVALFIFILLSKWPQRIVSKTELLTFRLLYTGPYVISTLSSHCSSLVKSLKATSRDKPESFDQGALEKLLLPEQGSSGGNCVPAGDRFAGWLCDAPQSHDDSAQAHLVRQEVAHEITGDGAGQGPDFVRQRNDSGLNEHILFLQHSQDVFH